MRHLIDPLDLSKAETQSLLELATRIRQDPAAYQEVATHKKLATLFYEPSTRTRLSFEAAMLNLGGHVLGFPSDSVSSASKGESVADTIRIVSCYADIAAMRHPKEGSARLAAEVANVPVINGGDGANQHPSQTLLDLFSIAECQGQLSNLSVAFVGDLKYGRTVHSLAQALTWFNPTFYFVAPEVLKMPSYIEQSLIEKGVSFRYVDTLEEAVSKVDILYMTRVQKERFDPTEYMHIASQYVLRAEMLAHAKPNMKVLHPLPRIDEIHPDVDASPFAYYFQQAENGVYAREALLALVLNETIKELNDA